MLMCANVTVHAAQMSLPPELETVFDMITVNANKLLKFDGYGVDEGCTANLVVIDAKNIREAMASRRTAPTSSVRAK